MAIETVEKCDFCEQVIEKEQGRQGFPQLSWCFFRKGFVMVKDNRDKHYLLERWQGSVNRLEFCQIHGEQFNVLLKAFVEKSAVLEPVLQQLVEADRVRWAGIQKDLQDKFNLLAPEQRGQQ